MQHMDDSAMLNALKGGDIKAYQYFFMKYYKPLCLKARMMLNSMEEAEQMVQKIFVEVWEERLYLEIEQSVGGYFYRKVHNSCVNLVRKSDSGNHYSTDHGFLLMQGMLPAMQMQNDMNTALLSYNERIPELFRILEKGFNAFRRVLNVTLEALCIHIKL
ncbi:DNA-directed RNA polymerase specialized sigma subunit, sigma24 family [Chitinophaga sp. YR573]|uniref:sigma factor n=1 Tax=Chitinophaga sp. YR573 TaxID=1881040 RepID=UPI0008B10616|nr:sigma factor [Chitinophaga sp. YR573]SEW37539.1 DNA-directed RNA polymerase specialized sigma subunit, sigma24 family [Chitinophaga sp. YR573]